MPPVRRSLRLFRQQTVITFENTHVLNHVPPPQRSVVHHDMLPESQPTVPISFNIPFETIPPSQPQRSAVSAVSSHIIGTTAFVLPHRRQQGVRHLSNAARLPYEEVSIVPHTIGGMVVACIFCNAMHWKGETRSGSTSARPLFGVLCCKNGRIDLAPVQDPPLFLRQLLVSSERWAKKFREDIWKYNRTFSFTSLGVQVDHTVNARSGPPVFRICGELHHLSGSLTASSGQPPRYSQLYVYDDQEAFQARVQQNTTLDPVIMASLQVMITQHHQYAAVYKSCFEILQNYDSSDDARIQLRLDPTMDKRRYNLPTLDEVAVILPGEAIEPRDIILRLRDGPLRRISDLHPGYSPLQYPLLFPYGENGWHNLIFLKDVSDHDGTNRSAGVRPEIVASADDVDSHERDVVVEDRSSDGDPRKVTLMMHTTYRINYRPNEFNTLLRGGRLFQRYVVDMFATIDQQRLLWFKLNQSTIRAARYNNLEDAHVNDPLNVDLNALGQRIFLPSSYGGGPRSMNQRYQDAMAISRYYRKVDIFLTITTNPMWEEIQCKLLENQTAYDRPDLVVRVFHLKLKALLDYIYKKEIFGPVSSYVYTIEFQKRGLPHAHLLIYLKDGHKLTTTDAIDSCIMARWPDPILQPRLHSIVQRCMVHGPCNDRCLVKGKCSKGFPKVFNERTTMDAMGYPHYFRPDDGVTVNIGNRQVDNRYIVPYCPFLSSTFDCHINVECAVSIASIKYLYKYVYKGPDMAGLEVELNDEVTRYVSGRYVSATDAAWRIFGFETHKQVPNVIRLQVHLPGDHMAIFDPDDDMNTVLNREESRVTTLTAFFDANRTMAGGDRDQALSCTYQEFPQKFTFVRKDKRWAIRKQGFAIGRMYNISPSAGELFYLRTLLTVVKGPTSFEDLRRLPGAAEPAPTFYAACLQRGLLEHDGEWVMCLEEASSTQSGSGLRQLFVTLLLFCHPADPLHLWNQFKDQICDDLYYQLEAIGYNTPSLEIIYDYGLYLIDKLLQEGGRSLRNWPSLPKSVHMWDAVTSNPLIAEQLSYNPDNERLDLEDRLPQLNIGQQAAYDAIVDSVNYQHGRLFFLNGPGGTGKTFVYNTICAKLRSEGKICICVSSSGISALLIRGGRTAHSMFKIPLDGLDGDSFCSINKDSDRALLLQSAEAIIWDEVSAQHRNAVEAVERTLRDIRGDDRIFGGVTVILGGDFLQTLPVVPKGSRADTVLASIRSSSLWDNIHVLRLTHNMRLDPNDTSSVRFAQWLLDVGHGRENVVDTDSFVQIEDSMCAVNEESLIDSIYPNIVSNPPPAASFFTNRMILAPRNVDVNDLNDKILSGMHGDSRTYYSADSVANEPGADPDNNETVSVEYLRSLHPGNLPPGELCLKIGCPVILLRNIAPSRGLCNGTRMVIVGMMDHILEGRLLGGQHDGDRVMIPRVNLTPSDNSDHAFRFTRRQFPVRLAFAMSINKSQGQSVDHVGIKLSTPVFSHGQLYVALSRATSKHNIRILLPHDTSQQSALNIVYKEVLV